MSQRRSTRSNKGKAPERLGFEQEGTNNDKSDSQNDGGVSNNVTSEDSEYLDVTGTPALPDIENGDFPGENKSNSTDSSESSKSKSHRSNSTDSSKSPKIKSHRSKRSTKLSVRDKSTVSSSYSEKIILAAKLELEIKKAEAEKLQMESEMEALEANANQKKAEANQRKIEAETEAECRKIDAEKIKATSELLKQKTQRDVKMAEISYQLKTIDLCDDSISSVGSSVTMERTLNYVTSLPELKSIPSDATLERNGETVTEKECKDFNQKVAQKNDVKNEVVFAQLEKSNVQNNVVNQSVNLESQRDDKLAAILSELVAKIPSPEHGRYNNFNHSKYHELPTFSGACEEWPAFISEFLRSSEHYRISNDENLRRLEKALNGAAREAVKSLFVSPDNVEEILDTLENVFGRPEWIMMKLMENARGASSPRNDNAESFIEFSNVISNLVVTAKSIDQEVFLQNPELLLCLVSKLSESLKIQWGQYAILHGSNLVNFSLWCKLIRNIICSTNYPTRIKNHAADKKPVQYKAKALLINNLDEDDQPSKMIRERKSCPLCNCLEHDIFQCKTFLDEEIPKRYDTIKELKLCFRCLKGRHFAYKCYTGQKCGVDGCKRTHHKLLHMPEPKDAIVNNDANNVHEMVAHQNVSESSVFLRIIPVKISGPNGEISTSALCDEASTITLIDKSLTTLLGIKGPTQPLCVQWTNNIIKEEEESQKVNVTISEDCDDGKSFVMKQVRTVDELSLPRQIFDAEEILKKYEYLSVVGDVKRHCDMRPQLLIGHDNLHLISPRSMIEKEGCPSATKAKLGWGIHGTGFKTSNSEFTYHICQRKMDDIHSMVKESFKLDGAGLKEDAENLSREDKRALALMENTIKFNGERYEMPLLWKDKSAILPESKNMALKRLHCLERKLDKNPEMAAQYCDKIDEYLQKGYASKIENPVSSLKEWYIPHFGVENINKPNKIRLVFDAASTSNGKCLNDFLMQGPDLVPPLVAVLWRFRRYKVAFSGDIKEMFHQVKIEDNDCAAQRFLFRGMDRHKTPDVFQMNVMIFGAVSSPSMAQFVKNKNAEQQGDYDIREAITKQHYVDDYLDGADSDEAAISKIQKIIEVHKSGGFEMVNWISNSKQVLDALPSHLKNKQVKSLNFDEPQIQRLLGLLWISSEDVFTFSVSFKKVNQKILRKEQIPTKREVLQVVMSVFDPLQFLGPIMMKAKLLLQDLWRCGIGWDEFIPENAHNKWFNWLSALNEIESFAIPRCYFVRGAEIENIQLHVFGDASEQAYAASVYLRFEEEGEVKVSFVSGKTRVAPLKHMTVPRLELQASLIASRLASTIRKEINLKIDRCFYWTDSMTVLSWIKSESKRFKMFVGSRVGEIQELTDVNDWFWVPTNDNPADKGTRDIDLTGNVLHNEWLYGPAFLLEKPEFWPKKNSDTNILNDYTGEEVQHIMLIEEVHQTTQLELPDMGRFSKWIRLIRSTAWLLRYKSNLIAKIGKSDDSKSCELKPDEILAAEVLWIRKVQQEQFGDELRLLKEKKEVSKTSQLYQLSPILDDQGIIRLNGRINDAEIESSVKQPIILSQKCMYTELLVKHYHEQSKHFGTKIVINELRQKFWIMRIHSVIKKVQSQCNWCKIKRARPTPPMMGSLPEVRLLPFVRPFTNSGVDYFGPLEVKLGRRIEKRYGVLFTCLSTRAIHIEIASNLETDTTIMAIRRFTARRGCPTNMYSDNGTNLKGADNELKKYIDELNQPRIEQEMTTQNIDWHFIPPRAPHMGGSWERMIGLVKSILKNVINEQRPREDTLHTVFCEAEALINSRPLTWLSDDASDEPCLTPNHFLIGTASVKQMPGTFDSNELISRKQWRRSQGMVNIFWKQWLKGYLPTLIKRNKWHEKSDPLLIGELVVIKDEPGERGKYPIGIITKVVTSADGQTRAAEVRTAYGCYTRPTVKLARIDVIARSDEFTGGSVDVEAE